MTSLHVIYHLVRADFLERVRRYSFLITLGLTIVAGYFFVPATGADYVTLDLDGYRGVYNSAWVGGLVALLTTLFLWYFGFYLVKNAVERDQRTGVGEIIAATPLGKPFYTLGKWLSNFATLAAMVGVLALAALAMQLIRGEEMRIKLWPLFSPFLFIALPTMAVVAAVALLFETIPGLRGGFGNVVYFFLATSVFDLPDRTGADVLGITVLRSSITAALSPGFPDYTGSFGVGFAPLGRVRTPFIQWLENFGYTPFGRELQTFRWEGIAWTPDILLERLAWVGFASGIALIAALFFNRFDPAGGLFSRLALRAPSAGRVSTGGGRKPLRPNGEPATIPRAEVLLPAPIHLTRPATAPMRFRQVLLAELRLMLKEHRPWWYAVSAGLIVAGLLSSTDVARRFILPVAWIWPLLIWSAMGTREARHQTGQLVFVAPHPLRRQLPATWLAGVIVAALAGSGVAVRLVLTGDWGSLLAWMVGALFIPSLALALGCWSSSSKLFEVVYTVLWYIGPLNRVPLLDFMGVSSESVAPGVPLGYLGLTITLLGLAIIGRQRQLQV